MRYSGGTTTADPSDVGVRTALARWPVAAIAAVVGVLLLVTSAQYGYFGDELYFVAAGHHLDFSYADQPPLVPFLALLADTIAPGSVTVLRLPAIAATIGGVVVSALVARDLGGGKRAQIITAACYAVSPALIGGGHLLATSTVDPFLWTVIIWLLVRWMNTRQDKLLLWAGLVTAVDLQVKYLIVFFWIVAGIAALFFGPRDLLRAKMLWIGAAIAVLTSVPALLWQARNGWPQIQMGPVIAQEEYSSVGGAGGFLVTLALFAGVAGTPLAVYGLWRSIRLPQYRFLGVTAIVLVVVFILTGGRPYYPMGVLPVLWALGAVGLDGARRRWQPWVVVPIFLVSLMFVAVALPFRPVSSLRGATYQRDFVNVETVGWPEMADEVADAYRALPPDVRRHTTIMSGSYWPASAMAMYGPARGLPTAYSFNRGYWYFGTPPDSATTVLYIGGTAEDLSRYCGQLSQVGTVDNHVGVHTADQGEPIWLCGKISQPWSTLWPALRSL